MINDKKKIIAWCLCVRNGENIKKFNLRVKKNFFEKTCEEFLIWFIAVCQSLYSFLFERFRKQITMSAYDNSYIYKTGCRYSIRQFPVLSLAPVFWATNKTSIVIIIIIINKNNVIIIIADIIIIAMIIIDVISVPDNFNWSNNHSVSQDY